MSVQSVCDHIDVWCLNTVRVCVEWCVEWLSLSHRALERVLIALFVGADVAAQVLEGPRSGWMRTANLVGFLLTFVWAVLEHRRPAGSRLHRLVTGEGSLLRNWVLCNRVVFLLPTLLLPSMDRSDWLYEGAGWMFLLALYVMAWPQSGEPGKRRRAAVAEWKDSFGRQWMPEGVKG